MAVEFKPLPLYLCWKAFQGFFFDPFEPFPLPASPTLLLRAPMLCEAAAISASSAGSPAAQNSAVPDRVLNLKDVEFSGAPLSPQTSVIIDETSPVALLWPDCRGILCEKDPTPSLDALPPVLKPDREEEFNEAPAHDDVEFLKEMLFAPVLFEPDCLLDFDDVALCGSSSSEITV